MWRFDMRQEAPPETARLLSSASEVARQLSISERKQPVKIGKRSTRFRQADIDKYVESLSAG